MTRHAHDAPPRRQRFLGRRILVIATIAGAMTAPGQTVSVSVFVDHLIADLGLSREGVSTAYLIGTLTGALVLPTVGRLIDRAGARRAMIAIGIAFGLGLVAMSGVQGFVTLAIGFTLIRLLGQGSLSLVSSVALTHWYERRRGTMFGFMMTGVAALMSLGPILLNLAIEAYSWRTAWILAALAVWLVVVPMAWFGLVDRPSDVGQSVDGDPAPEPSAPVVAPATSHTRRQALGESRFWVLSATVGTTAMLITALNFHQISILGEKGLSSTEAAAMFLPQVAGAIVVGLAVGALADRISPRYLLAASMALMAIALLMVPFIERGWSVVLYGIVLGATAGAQRPLAATMLPRWFGLAHIGAIQGVSTFVGVGASAAGPVALAVARTLTGGYGTAAAISALLPLAMLFASLTVTEPDSA